MRSSLGSSNGRARKSMPTGSLAVIGPRSSVAPAGDSLAGRSVAPAGDSLAGRSVAPAGDSLAGRSVAPAGDSLAGRSVAPAGGSLAGRSVAIVAAAAVLAGSLPAAAQVNGQ